MTDTPEIPHPTPDDSPAAADDETPSSAAEETHRSASADGTSASGGPPAPDPTGRRRRSAPFARSSRDKVLGGIAGAVAARLDVEPVLVRVVLVVLAIASGGIAVPAYLLTWVVVARDDDPDPRLFEQVAIRQGGVLMWILGTLLAVAVLDGLTDPFAGPANFPLLPLALIGIGVALWTRGDQGSSAAGGTWPRRDAPPPPGVWPSASQDAATTDHPPTGSSTVPTDTTAATTRAAAGGGRHAAYDRPPSPPRPGAATGPPSPPDRPRERSVLGPVTIALALIAAGVAAALDATPGLAIDLGVTGVSAIALLVIGLGLLVGAVWGRARWLAAIGLLLMPFVAVGVLVDEAEGRIGADVDVASGLGERRVVVEGDEQLPEDLDLLAGSIQLDLSDWTPTAGDLAAIDEDDSDVRIDVGAGEVDLTMPGDVAWRVVSDIGLGEYEIRGLESTTSTSVDGFDQGSDSADGVDDRFVRTGGPDGGPVLDVSVDVGLGQVTIRETEPSTTDGGADTPADDAEELS